MSADEVAAHALASVQQSGVAVSGLMNNVLTTSMRLMPRSAIAAMTARAMRNRAR
jgi:uncharacterized protein YejL (UPF0352 family)